MSKQVPTQNVSDEVRTKLLEELKYGCFSKENRLPPEHELTTYFNISRTALRECLSQLEQEGMISRKQGVGTLINRRILMAETRVDLCDELVPTLEKMGKKATVSFVRFHNAKADSEIAESLGLQEDAPLLVSERLIYCDEKPAIYCVDYVPKDNVPNRQYSSRHFQPSIFTFLKKYQNTEVYVSLSEIRALGADKNTAKHLALPVGSPVLCLEDLGFDFWGEPILLTKSYVVDRVIKHMILRKKI